MGPQRTPHCAGRATAEPSAAKAHDDGDGVVRLVQIVEIKYTMDYNFARVPADSGSQHE